MRTCWQAIEHASAFSEHLFIVLVFYNLYIVTESKVKEENLKKLSIFFEFVLISSPLRACKWTDRAYFLIRYSYTIKQYLCEISLVCNSAVRNRHTKSYLHQNSKNGRGTEKKSTRAYSLHYIIKLQHITLLMLNFKKKRRKTWTYNTLSKHTFERYKLSNALGEPVFTVDVYENTKFIFIAVIYCCVASFSLSFYLLHSTSSNNKEKKAQKLFVTLCAHDCDMLSLCCCVCVQYAPFKYMFG